MDASETLNYKRSHFATQLPRSYLYTPTHAWMARLENNLWRVGLTKFATRMLGEIVDLGFNAQPNAAVKPGDVVGWIEGFKAISDLYCTADGVFQGANPDLKPQLSVISKDPYRSGWLYRVEGEPDSRCIDVEAYRVLLDETIDRIMAKQKASEEA